VQGWRKREKIDKMKLARTGMKIETKRLLPLRSGVWVEPLVCLTLGELLCPIPTT